MILDSAGRPIAGMVDRRWGYPVPVGQIRIVDGANSKQEHSEMRLNLSETAASNARQDSE